MAKDPYKYFRIEARELISELAKGALALEKDGSRPDRVAHLLRVAHTLKGAARVVKQTRLAEHAHAIEDVLSPHREATGPLDREAVQEMLGRVDALRAGLAALDPGSEPSPPRGHGASTPTAGVEPAPPAADTSFETVRVEVAEMDDLLDGVFQLGVEGHGLGREVEALEQLSELAGDLAGQVDRLGDRDAGDGRRLGRVRTLASELALRARRAARRLDAAAAELSKDVDDLRHQATAMRLVPAAAIEGDLARGVRDAAQASGTRVELRFRGGDLRVDAQVLSTMRGALLHVVRNAVAHGIEGPPERARAGKPEIGLVWVDVMRRGHRVAFHCRDDGRGVDPEAVRRVAAARGVLSGDEGALDMERTVELLLGGGLSTAAQPTHVSGRGVGLEAARAAALSLGGELRMESEPGRGTTVELVVPLSLSSLPALAVEVGGVTALVPLDAVAAAVDLRHQDVVRGEDGDHVVFQGCEAPLLWLELLVRGKRVHASQGRGRMAVIVRTGDGHAALVVDRIGAARSVVVRSLPPGTAAHPIVGGAAFGPSGVPEIVLSPYALGTSHGLRRPIGRPERPARLPILVIDDSLTTRMLEQSILESAGYEVDLAVSGEEALEKARARRYGLFLVDVEMPGMSGFELIERTRADPSLRDVPAILVTSLSSAEDRERGRAVGAHDYIVKSEFDQQALLKTIGRLVG